MITTTKRKKLMDLVENTNNELLFNSLWESANKFMVAYNSEIDEAAKRIDKGEFMTQDEVDARLEIWSNE